MYLAAMVIGIPVYHPVFHVVIDSYVLLIYKPQNRLLLK